MYDCNGLLEDVNKLCAALKGREFGIVASITQTMNLIEECSNANIQPDGNKLIKVSVEELIMLGEFRQAKLERAHKELEEIQQLKESLINSTYNDGTRRSING